MGVEINYLAVFLAAISTMVVGSIWYHPKVFGTIWSRFTKVDLNADYTPSQMAMKFGGVFIASLVSAYVLAHFVSLSYDFYKADYSFLGTALITGLWAWLAFTAARIFTHDVFEGRRKKLTLLNAAHEFVTFFVMALIIGLMGV
jgi:uncharacterized protein YacL